MNISKISDEDWNVINKYEMKDIRTRFLIEKSVSKPHKDYFTSLLVLINFILIILVYLLNGMNYYNIIAILFPVIIIICNIILGHHYGKEPKYRFFTLLINLSIFLLAEYAIMYYFINNLNMNINTGNFIFASFYGIIVGAVLGLGLNEIVSKNIFLGNPNNYKIEVLSHTEKLGLYEDVFINVIHNVIDLNNIPEFYEKNGKIFRKVGFGNIYLLYTIVENFFTFIIFSKNGMYIFQDKKTIDIQSKISFLLKNALDFKNVDEEKQKNNAINSCLDLLMQYAEPNTLRILIDDHKNMAILLISLIGLVILYPLYSSYMDKILEDISDSIIPVLFSAIVIVILEYSLRKNK